MKVFILTVLFTHLFFVPTVAKAEKELKNLLIVPHFNVCLIKDGVGITTPKGKTTEIFLKKGWKKVNCDHVKKRNRIVLGSAATVEDYDGPWVFFLLENGEARVIGYGNDWEQSLLKALK